MPAKPEYIKKLSLKSRLLIATCLWLTAMVITAGVGIPTLVKAYLVQDVKNRLWISMDELTANIETTAQGTLRVSHRLSDPRFNQPYSGLYWSVASRNQTLRSRSLWDKNIVTKHGALSEHLLGARNEPLTAIEQQIYLPDFSEPIMITMGLDKNSLNKTLTQLTGQLWIILGMLYLGILTIIGIQVLWSLRPLSKLQKELKALRSGAQNKLLEDYPREVLPLINDLNALLFHYQELLARARNHAGNLSHALKTPLAVLNNEVATLPCGEQQTRLRQQVQQLQKQIDYHLGRARMAGAMNILAVRACPAERIDAISKAFDKVYAARGITLVNELDSDIYVAVEPDDLDEMLGNLLENSYKWANSLIRIHGRIQQKQTLFLNIEDDGPGINDADLDKVTRRGVRLDETTPGSGLGLNIVSEMAYSYRGELTLAHSDLGGLKATLTLKLSQN